MRKWLGKIDRHHKRSIDKAEFCSGVEEDEEEGRIQGAFWAIFRGD